MGRWFEGPITGFDLETTAPIPERARIVTAAIITRGLADGEKRDRTWLVAVDEEIPAEATAIHGVTTERARAEGVPLASALLEIGSVLMDAWKLGPVVAFNASYDFTVLAAEMERCGLARLPFGPVVDPLVIDRQLDKWRKGSRKLVDMAAHYGAQAETAHEAAGDALMAMRLAYILGKRFAYVGALPLLDLHTRQVQWAREQRESLQAYKRRSDAAAVVDVGWPLTAAFAAGR